MGLHDDDLKILDRIVRAELDLSDLAEADVSGWDFSMQSFDFDEDLERRAALNGGKDTVWYAIAKSHFYCMQRKLFVLSSGETFEQQLPGIMPSGWYLTSSTNSYVRNLTSLQVAGVDPSRDPFAIAMGDDSVEPYIDPERAREAYEALGKRCKFYRKIERNGAFEFCSTKFSPNQLGVPVNIDKLLFNLLSLRVNNLEDMNFHYDEFEQNIRNLPLSDRRELLDFVESTGWTASWSA